MINLSEFKENPKDYDELADNYTESLHPQGPYQRTGSGSENEFVITDFQHFLIVQDLIFMFAWMLRLFQPAERDPKDVLFVWRHRIFSTIFISSAVVALLPWATNLREAIRSDQLVGAAVYTTTYFLTIFVALAKFIPFKVRAWVGISLFYLTGITSLITLGPAGSGRLYLVLFAVLTTLILGLRAGLIALVLNVTSVFLWSWVVVNNMSGFSLEMSDQAIHWNGLRFSFLLTNAVITISLGVMVSVLERKINMEQSLSNELKISNRRLEQDIIAREEAERALRKSENRYKTLTQNLQVGIFRYTGGGKNQFLEANPAMLKLFGFRSRNDIKGLNITDFFQDHREKDAFTHKLRRYGYVRNEKLALMKKDGTPMVCDVSSVAIKDEAGNIRFYDGVIQDITERVQLENQLRQAQKLEAMGTLAGGVAHDLNNILSGVVSYPDLILMDLDKKSPLRSSIKTIQDSGKKAAAIVQDLLTLARRGVTISEVVNLNDVIERYLNSPECQKMQAFHPNVAIRTDLDPDLLNMMGSPVHISKTIMNLASNAAEAMPDGGVIRIETKSQYFETPLAGSYEEFEPGEYVILSLSDSGVGIAPDEVDRIFEPFYTKKEMGRSGTGLGMAVVWGTVKDHSGYIDVKSTVGKGTRFKVIFPATREKLDTAKKQTDIDTFSGNGERILVVDDVFEQREVATKILKALGYSVCAVESGEAAIDHLKKQSADLVILDMIMTSGMLDGLETYQEIVKTHPGQKAIITSGFSENKRVRQAQALGAGQYVRKPYTLAKIGSAIKKELLTEPKAA